MDSYEKIEGLKLLDIFTSLYKNQTLLKIYLFGSDYEQLTVITKLDTKTKQPFFQIDVPEGLHSALNEKQTDQLCFEFTGEDRLTYKFETHLDVVEENKLILNIPEGLRRYQFRHNFRIKAPRGAHLLVTLDKTDVRMTIDNISLGGAFCLCLNKYKTLVEANPFIIDATLLFTFMDQSVEVSIATAECRRMEPVIQPKKFGVAYEFVKISKEANRLLTQQIYELQREILQGRQKNSQ